ncbi:proton-conducting transporter transmembrane domain-containing protein [Enhygromyxa salina]|uniref:NADH-quinone oxidoreductase subunit L n=1 Tax=Enhygromyxa salina TaxID=215803 RepID=A0A2S9YYG9_9BACT|nr:proton-conducting transporter membrane subunit [Enhygromyxa salina]PRQ10140.1 NADH-quinone oxidoreductase subunit L [Enhygromyxa salina]
MSFVDLTAQVMIAVPLAPLLAFVVVALAELGLPTPASERVVARSVRLGAAVALVGSVWLAIALARSPATELVLDRSPWFEVGHYKFAARLTVDSLSAIMLVLASTLTLIGVRFSVSYMHRDPGFRRFFALIALFEAGLMLLLEAGTIDLLFIGWEIVGLTSTFLIAFFHGRDAPLAAGLRAFVTYRSCDVGLLAGAVLLHHYAHTSAFDGAFGAGHWPVGTAHLEPHAATLIALLFMLAAMGKAGAFPVGGWLPRAMEGPTPSSALFYGGLSVSAGAYLLLRVAPLFAESMVARVALGLVGVATAVHATIVGRVQTDAKTQLTYASATQIGLVFVWIALDLRWLAIFHLFGHISLRTFQLLRAPAILADRHHRLGALGGAHVETGRHLERMFPARLRLRLYALARAGFDIDSLLDLLLVAPLLSVAHRAARFERAVTAMLVRPRTGRGSISSSQLDDEDLA